MLLFVLACLGGVLTIVNPFVLPVIPFVLARADRPFLRGDGAASLSAGSRSRSGDGP
jgi:cytochrome c biogenesis protein CcdA